MLKQLFMNISVSKGVFIVLIKCFGICSLIAYTCCMGGMVRPVYIVNLIYISRVNVFVIIILRNELSFSLYRFLLQFSNKALTRHYQLTTEVSDLTFFD